MATTTSVKILEGLGGTEFIQANLCEHRFPLHFHDTFVIELVLAGEDWCSEIESAAGQGEVYVHFPFAPHTGGTVGSKRLVYSAIYPSLDLFASLIGMDRDSVPSGTSFVSSNRSLVNCLHGLFAVLNSKISSDASVEQLLKDAFEAILEEQSASHSGGENDIRSPIYQKMLVAREYLQTNFTRDVTTNELSDNCDVSQFHLIRSFRKYFGITPRQFLISHRVAQAKQMIASGCSVTETAYSTGFADQSHLARYFKKITSYSPRQFKPMK